jgi:ionotropic glutamate receptor
VLIAYLAMFVYRERHELRAAEPGSGSVSLKRVRAWLQHYDRKDMTAPHFKQQLWSDSPSANGSSHGKKRERAEQDESRDFGGPGASPLSDHYRMDSASPLERKGSGEFRTPFDQRTGEAALERKPSLKLQQNTEERKKLPLSP